MEKNTIKHLKELASYSSIGLSIALAIFIGLFIGVFIDGKYGTHPIFTFVFLGLGIAAGFRNIALMAQKSKKV